MNTIIIGQLYPELLNIYGDTGNVITLKYRLESRGYTVKIVPIALSGQKLPTDIDILVGGGGQDSAQQCIEADIHSKQAGALKSMIEDGLPVLAICGTYQMLGHRFITRDKNTIKGIGVLDLETVAKKKRLIGNIGLETEWGVLTGFENHSGQTFLHNNLSPLGVVVSGYGNNESDRTEGAIYKNCFGTYMHGPVLPKNPKFADELIKRTLVRKFGTTSLAPLDDTLEIAANQFVKQHRL